MEKDHPPNHLTFVFFNVNRIPIAHNANKSMQMIDHLAHYKVDVAMIAETGWNPNYIPTYGSWHERTKGRLPTTHAFSSNKHESSKTPSLWGGTLTIAAHNGRS